MYAIEIKGFKKIYKNKVKAVDNLDLNVPMGSFFGFVGPNGAGKSTTVNFIAGLIRKSNSVLPLHDFFCSINRKPQRENQSTKQEKNGHIFPESHIGDNFGCSFSCLHCIEKLYRNTFHLSNTPPLIHLHLLTLSNLNHRKTGKG